MASRIGTAYVQVRGDLSQLNKQMVANLHPARLGKLGKAAGIGIGAGLAAGVAGKGLFDLGSKFDDQFDKIRTGTGATGAALKGLEADFKDVAKSVPGSFDDAGDAITRVNQRLGLTGKPLRDVSRQFLQLSRITKTDVAGNVRAVARAFVDWEVPVRKQSKTLDGFFRLAQRSGIGVAELAESIQKFGSPLRQLGFTLEESAAMFATFEKAGVNTQTMVPGLKLALANLTRPTAGLGTAMQKLGIEAGKPEVALRQVFKLLGDNSTLTRVQKIGLAMDVFGKRAGADMAEAIKQGRFSVEDMVKVMNDGTDTIDAAEKQTRDFNESWDILKKRVFVGLEPIATKFFTAISDGMEKLATADFSKIGADLQLGSIDTSGLKTSLEQSTADIREILNSGLVRFLAGTVLGSVKRSLQGMAQAFKGSVAVLAASIALINDLLHFRFLKAWQDVKSIFRGGAQVAIGTLRQATGPIREVAARTGVALASPFRSAWGRIGDIFSGGVRGALGALRGFGSFIGRLASGPINVLLSAFGKIAAVLRTIVGWARRVVAALSKIKPPKIKVPDITPGFDIPGIPFGAKGIKSTKDPLAVVGEEGPELVRLPVGSRVFSHPESKRMARERGIQAFARGGIVRRRKDEDHDPTARKGQDPERSETGKQSDRTLRSAQASTGKASSIASRADKLDSLHLPYRWGGGHGAVGEALKRGFDCSGAVSYALGISPRVSGQLMFYGAPGKGAVSVFANQKHTFMSIDGRGFGTGKENPGGGAGWLSYNARPGFAVRHVPGLGEAAFEGVGTKKVGLPRRLSLGQYVTLAKEAKFPDPALAAAVFYAESTGNTKAVGDHGTSFGAAQIHLPDHKNYDKDKLLNDVRYNFKAAYKISGSGKNFKPWTQYKNGAYKKFLGASPDPLPKGGATGSPASKADWLAYWLEEAIATPGKTDDLRQINKSLSYWRGILKRNRGSDPKRASEALGHVTELREQKVALREAVEQSAYELTPLGKQIGSGGAIFSIQALQGVLDSIEHDSALAALTETLDSKGNVTPASFTDDVAAATKLRDLWQYLFGLTTGAQSLPGQGHWQNAPGEQPLDRLGRPTSAAKAKWWMHADGTVSGAPRTIAVAGKPVPIIGTAKQQTYAAQQLKESRDALKSLQDEMKSEDVSVTDTGPSFAEQAKAFLAALGDLKRQFGSNFKPIRAFAKGGVLKHSLALVGEQGFEMAKKGSHIGAVGLGGPEIRELPVNTRIYPHEQSKRIAKQMGIQPFAQGGVIQPSQPVSQAPVPDPELAKALKRIEALLKEQRPVQNIHQELQFKQAPEDQHAVQKSALFELEAAV